MFAYVGQGVKKGFQNAIYKKILVWNYKAKSIRKYFGKYHNLEVLNQSCSNYVPGAKLTPPRGSKLYIELYKEIFKQLLLLSHFWEFVQT